MLNLEADVFLVRLFLSWSMAIFILLCGIEAWRISHLLRNPRLTKIFGKIAFGLVIFFVFRMLSSLVDNAWQFSLPFAAYLVNYIFWLWVLNYFRWQRKTIASERIGETGRQRLSSSIDQIIDEMTQAREHLSH